jgi:GTP-binding protein
VKITADFVRSAAGNGDFPRQDAPALALIGRSNVGKSSLINALVRQRVARTSATPGKTRLANIYRVRRGTSSPLYLVDLPGYGYARGGSSGFFRLVRDYFASPADPVEAAAIRGRNEKWTSFHRGGETSGRMKKVALNGPIGIAALLLVDLRHPGLENDIQAWNWLKDVTPRRAVVATKIDKLARGERIRALRELESVFENPVLPVSAVTGEGLDDLWKLIDTLTPNPKLKALSHSRRAETGPRLHPNG